MLRHTNPHCLVDIFYEEKEELILIALHETKEVQLWLLLLFFFFYQWRYGKGPRMSAILKIELSEQKTN